MREETCSQEGAEMSNYKKKKKVKMEATEDRRVPVPKCQLSEGRGTRLPFCSPCTLVPLTELHRAGTK